MQLFITNTFRLSGQNIVRVHRSYLCILSTR